MKNDQIRDSFTYTEAYSELFIEFLEHADLAAEFFKGIIPKEAAAALDATITQMPVG
jgi:hypothetical protein